MREEVKFLAKICSSTSRFEQCWDEYRGEPTQQRNFVDWARMRNILLANICSATTLSPSSAAVRTQRVSPRGTATVSLAGTKDVDLNKSLASREFAYSPSPFQRHNPPLLQRLRSISYREPPEVRRFRARSEPTAVRKVTNKKKRVMKREVPADKEKGRWFRRGNNEMNYLNETTSPPLLNLLPDSTPNQSQPPPQPAFPRLLIPLLLLSSVLAPNSPPLPPSLSLQLVELLRSLHVGGDEGVGRVDVVAVFDAVEGDREASVGNVGNGSPPSREGLGEVRASEGEEGAPGDVG